MPVDLMYETIFKRLLKNALASQKFNVSIASNFSLILIQCSKALILFHDINWAVATNQGLFSLIKTS